MSRPKQPTRTYRLFTGFQGSAFTMTEEFDTRNASPWYVPRNMLQFLRANPEIHDLSWSTDDGRTYVVKRKTSDNSEVLGDADATR